MFTRDTKFELRGDEYDRLFAWWQDLRNRKLNGSTYFGAVGGGVTITFCQTSIGQVITAKCCGEEFTVRDI